jgi:hypothetical protein
MEDLYRMLDVHSMIADGIVQTCERDGKVWYRYHKEWPDQMSLEEFFIDYLWGLPGWKSKVIGNVILFWEV